MLSKGPTLFGFRFNESLREQTKLFPLCCSWTTSGWNPTNVGDNVVGTEASGVIAGDGFSDSGTALGSCWIWCGIFFLFAGCLPVRWSGEGLVLRKVWGTPS